MRTKKVRKIATLMLAVVMVVSSLYVGKAYAMSWDELHQALYEESCHLISQNDIAVFSDDISHYKLTDPGYVICPNDTAYQIVGLNKSNGEWVSSGAEFDNAVANAANLPYDKSLNALGIDGLYTLDICWVNYLSRDLTVVDGDTSIFIPGKVAGNDGFATETDFCIRGRKSDGTWETLITTYEPRRRWNTGTSQDMTIKCSDFMKSDYVYYTIITTRGTETIGSATEVEHLMVPDGNLEAFKKLCNRVSILPKTVDVGPEGTMYRLFNENSGEHLYTADAGEAQYLTDIDWNYEGHAWQAPTSSTTPVYRLFNPATGEHHYTKDEGERDYLDGIGWNYESIAFYSDDNKGVPMYRLFNPNATGAKQAGSHHYTKDEGERDYLIATGWNYEGISWYGM